MGLKFDHRLIKCTKAANNLNLVVGDSLQPAVFPLLHFYIQVKCIQKCYIKVV